MRKKEFNVRVRISEQQGREIYEMSLRENRSQSSAISILVSEALAARRAAAASNEELVREGLKVKIATLIEGVASDFPKDGLKIKVHNSPISPIFIDGETVR